MKKLLFLAIFAFVSQMLNAQDLKKVQTSYMLNRFEEAKTELDKVLADPKQQTKIEALYWNSKVDAAIFKKAAANQIKVGNSKNDVEKQMGKPSNISKITSEKDYNELYFYPGAEIGFDTNGIVKYIHELDNAINLKIKAPVKEMKDADEAFKKYIAVDPAYAQVKEKGAEGFFDMYGTAYSIGVKVFNDKKWEDAIVNFMVAVDYSDIIFKNKWTSSSIPFDTTSILFLGYSYQNATKNAEAVKQYTRLADGKVGGESNIDMYKFLANQFTITKNEANFTKYIAISKELYPKEVKIWEEFEIEYMDENLTLKQKTDMYDKEDAAGSLSEVKYLQFGDIFVTAEHKEKNIDSLQKIKYSLKAVEAFQKAFAKNNQNGIAAFNG